MENNWRKIIKFSLPATFIGLAELLLIGISLFWSYIYIGKPEALAAIRLSGAIITLIEAVTVSIISSLLVYVSQLVGAKKLEEAKKGAGSVLSFSFYAGLCTTLVGLLLMPVFKLLFGVTIETKNYLSFYLSVFLIGYFIISVNSLLLLLPRYFQKLKIIYWGLTILVLVNIAVTPFLIALCKRFELNLIIGPAIGVIVSNFICAIFLLNKIFIKDELGIGLTKKMISLKFKFYILKDNKGYILSQVLTGVTFNISMFLYILILSYYPKNIFNVYSISIYIFMMLGIFPQNFSATIIPLAAQYMGAGKVKEVIDLAKKMLLVLLIYGGIAACVLLISKDLVLNAMSINNNLKPLVKEFLNFYTIPWVFNMLAFIFIFVVAAAGDTKGGLFLTIINMYVLVISSLLLVPHLFRDINTGVFFTLGLIELLTFMTSCIYFLGGKWKSKSLIQHTQEQSKQKQTEQA
ncbi:MATE family efflux transporter [Heyndrickxia acidicola]|uniref:MATE family efflux transporter n=1 Tax=Heyndrickxia acidicola TaxID=209389 RepID=UPI0008264262|nr:MATE family efflux transporter [Heyndrickxia acidicola]